MMIGGMQKFSLVDFPGRTSAVLFTAMCNMRCGYCHNLELVLPELFEPSLDMGEVYDFLGRRVGKLDGIVLTGGEPTVHKDTPSFLRDIKQLGFAVKLDSNGTNPEMLGHIIEDNLVDYIAMDIKGPLNKYFDIVGRPVDTAAIQKSIRLIIDSGVDYEFRTTVVKNQLEKEDFYEIGKLIEGAERCYLQTFRPIKTLDPCFEQYESCSEEDMENFQLIIDKYVGTCDIR